MTGNYEYPLDGVEFKDEYSPYKRYEEISGGKIVYVDVPHKYHIKLTCYDMIPGVSVLIDSVELLERYRDTDNIVEYKEPDNVLLINYIIEGHCQLKLDEDKYMFIKEHFINMYVKEDNPHSFSYFGKNHIFHILINKRQFEESVTEYNREYLEIINKLFEIAKESTNIVFKPNAKIDNILKDLKDFKPSDEISKRIFFQLKTLEILVLLYESNIKDEKIEQRTYNDAQIRVVRQIKNQLSRDIASYISLEVLSMSYGINLTSLKNCFKDMYGKPLYTWYREYKFHRAMELIKNTDYPISKIAHMVGYKSSSKFAKAFKQEMGDVPSSYRKNKK